LTLWNALRREAALPIKAVKRELADVLKKAKRRDVDWVFIDTPANVSASVVAAIQAARLVIVPCRAGLLDIEAVQETIDFSRRLGTPYALVLNGAAARGCGVAGRDRGARMSGGTEGSGLGRPGHPSGELFARGLARRGRAGTGGRSRFLHGDRPALAGDREIRAGHQGRPRASGDAPGRGVAAFSDARRPRSVAFVIASESKTSQPLAKKNVHADASLTADCRIKSGNDE
jgi:hypothetical protein